MRSATSKSPASQPLISFQLQSRTWKLCCLCQQRDAQLSRELVTAHNMAQHVQNIRANIRANIRFASGQHESLVSMHHLASALNQSLTRSSYPCSSTQNISAPQSAHMHHEAFTNKTCPVRMHPCMSSLSEPSLSRCPETMQQVQAACKDGLGCYTARCCCNWTMQWYLSLLSRYGWGWHGKQGVLHRWRDSGMAWWHWGV